MSTQWDAAEGRDLAVFCLVATKNRELQVRHLKTVPTLFRKRKLKFRCANSVFKKRTKLQSIGISAVDLVNQVTGEAARRQIGAASE